jgi:L-fuconolactonase
MDIAVIDIHPHIISGDETRYPKAPLGGVQSKWSQERPTTWEQMITAMDDAGVAKAALVQSSTTYGFDNSYVAEAVALRPQRFTGVFSVDVMAPDAADCVRHWHDRGLTGLRLFTTGSTMPGQSDVLGHPKSFAAWQAATDLGIPVCVQMKPEGLPKLHTLMDRFPRTRIILDHLMFVPLESGPPYADTAPLFSLADHPAIFLKVTTFTIRAAQQGKATPESFFRKLLGAFGAQRIAWGSNFPANDRTLKDMLQEADGAFSFASEQDRKAVFRETALSLYPSLRD